MNERREAADATASAQRYTRGEKTAERVARSILESIAADSLTAGVSLPTEVVMLKEQGVGRATLREALRILEVNGLITIKPGPGGGPIVTAASAADFGHMATMHFQRAGLRFRDLLDARLTLEPVMARKVAERVDQKAIDTLGEVRQKGRDTDPGDDLAYASVTRLFHRVLTELSGNPLLDFLTCALVGIHSDRFGLDLDESPPDRRKVLDAHDAIAAAVIAGDGDVTQRLTHEHMRALIDSAAERQPGLMNEVINWS